MFERITKYLFMCPLSPKIDFYGELLLCAAYWASNHKFMSLTKLCQETYYLLQYITLSF